MNEPIVQPKCPRCGERMHLEAPIWGGPDEWVCLVCTGPEPPDEAA